MTGREPCPGCGLALPPGHGPTHPYIGASAACWALFGTVLAREPERAHEGMAAAHRLTVDAYAVQHPGEPEPRSIRSVGLHLVALELALEEEVAPVHVTRLLAVAAGRIGDDLRWLEPPERRGALTVAHVADAPGPAEHVERAWAWARDVWVAWSVHHTTVRAWASQVRRSG